MMSTGMQAGKNNRNGDTPVTLHLGLSAQVYKKKTNNNN